MAKLIRSILIIDKKLPVLPTKIRGGNYSAKKLLEKKSKEKKAAGKRGLRINDK